jgi:hypothetical protein
VIQSIPQHPSYSEKRRQHPKRPNIIDKSREKWDTLGYAHPPISIIQDMQPVETKEVGRKQHSTGDPTPAPVLVFVRETAKFCAKSTVDALLTAHLFRLVACGWWWWRWIGWVVCVGCTYSSRPWDMVGDLCLSPFRVLFALATRV